MLFYQEITLLPNAEIGTYFLWSKLYQQIHLGLVDIQNDLGRVQIGVSFPEYVTGKKNGLLGKKLRLFAQEESTLVRFNAGKWLSRLSDYVHCTGIRRVPERVCSYAMYSRLHPKVNAERLARRYAKRHSLTLEQALLNYGNFEDEKCNLPFIQLKSLSSNHNFNLFIMKKTVNEIINNGFTSYGLSSVSSVPEF